MPLLVLAYVLCGGTARAHDMMFGSKWDDLRFMGEEDAGTPPSPGTTSKVRMDVCVLEVHSGRGKRVANSITGRTIRGWERSGVLTGEQYETLLQSVSEGWNQQAFQSTVVTPAHRLGTMSWTPEGEERPALVDLRFARDNSGLWEGWVEFQGAEAEATLEAAFWTTASRFFLRGKSSGDWLLVVTVAEEPSWNQEAFIDQVD